MTMRERMLALIQGREMDRVPFVMYDIMVPPAEVYQLMGPGSIGLLRWSPIWRVAHPNCRFEVQEYREGEIRRQRTTLHTPKGSIFELKAFEPVHNSGSIRKHYIQEAADYEVLWAYLEDSVIRENYEQFYRDRAELGENGLPLAHVERTPWQQLWIQWVGLENLSLHVADYPDRVACTMDLLQGRARCIFEIAYRSPAPFIDFPDNITAPAIGPQRFCQYALPLYDELASMMGERPVFVHMDGELKPLWGGIARSKVGGLDSFTPVPDCDTTVAEALSMWPDKRLWVHFPSSVQLHQPEEVRAMAETILAAGGHTGRLQIQISEDVPPHIWRTTFPLIADAVECFGPP
jgi:hypothetical protein